MQNLTEYIAFLEHLKTLNKTTLNIDEVITSLKEINPLRVENISELSKLAQEINAKQFKRPIVEHKYTKGDWIVKSFWNKKLLPAILISTKNGSIQLNYEKWFKNKKEAEANARLISQAPKMHILCEAFFDMLKHKYKSSLYLPILEEVLNEINPKK